MEKFKYTGETASGEAVSQVVSAADRYAVYEIARTNGHTVSKVEQVKAFSFSNLINIEKINYKLSKVKLDELVMMTRNLSSMLKAGLPLSRALSVIERQTKNPRLKGTISEVRERINKGDAFNDALRSFPETFSKLYVAMVRAGEESGGLAEALSNIGTQLERLSKLKKKIKGAMIYPVIVITVMIIIGVLMMVYVMPTLTETFLKMGTELPATTQFLINTSTFINENGLLVILSTFAIIGGIVSFARTAVGRRLLHFTFIHMPVIGTLVKETNSAYTARTLSSLFSAGVDVLSAIDITEEVLQNVYYKEVLKSASKKIEKGQPLSEAFTENEHIYPVLVGEMVLVGEETGQLSEMLSEIAIFYENEVEQKTKDLSTIIEPILMVCIGGGVGFFALAMIAPIYSITESI